MSSKIWTSRPSSTSWILSAFQFAIMLQPLCGYVMDSVGLKLGFAIFAIAWSFVSMAHGLANNWQALFGLRALLGFAEGSANPAGMKATSEWFPAAERGLAGGFFNMGASLGSMLAAPLVAWAILTHSWQFAFVLTGVIGFAWVALWLVFYQSPSKHKALSAGGTRPHPLGPGAPPRWGRQTLVPDHSWPAELLGHRHPEVPCRSDVGHADVLAAALSDDRAWIRSEADRDVRVAAIPGSRSGLHVRRHDQHCAAEATVWV